MIVIGTPHTRNAGYFINDKDLKEHSGSRYPDLPALSERSSRWQNGQKLRCRIFV